MWLNASAVSHLEAVPGTRFDLTLEWFPEDRHFAVAASLGASFDCDQYNRRNPDPAASIENWQLASPLGLCADNVLVADAGARPVLRRQHLLPNNSLGDTDG